MSILNGGKSGKSFIFRSPYSFTPSSKKTEEEESQKPEPENKQSTIAPTPRRYATKARKFNINVAVSFAEKAEWKRQARKEGITLSAYIRKVMNS